MVEAKTWIGTGREGFVVLLKLRHSHSKPLLEGRIVVDRDVVLPPVCREEQGLISRQLTRVHAVQQRAPRNLQTRCVEMRFGEEIAARKVSEAVADIWREYPHCPTSPGCSSIKR